MRNSILILLAAFALAGCPQEKPEVQGTDSASSSAPVVAANPGAPQPPVKADKTTGKPSSSLQVVTATFKVEGMTCADCSKAIESKLIGMPGVSTVSADEKAGRAIVQYDEAKITKQDIIAAIDSLKFKATIQ